jgi:hypothetical protein
MSAASFPWQPISALAGGLALAGAISWAVLTDPEMPIAPRPGWGGGPLVEMTASLPPIGPWEQFYDTGKDANPFIPWRDRVIEQEAVRPSAKPRDMLPPRPPPGLPKEIPPPKLTYSKLPASATDAPRIKGVVGRGESVTVLVERPGVPGMQNLKPGEKAGRWTLISADGQMASFSDDTGRVFEFLVGR